MQVGTKSDSFQMVAVSAVSRNQARLWLRTNAEGISKLELWTLNGEARTAVIGDNRAPEADGTMSFVIPGDAPEIGLLKPATKYKFRITISETDEFIGEGRFETAPDETGDNEFAFAFMSCHQPFKSDGSIIPESAQMLSTLNNALEERNIKYVLMIGDQIYADSPTATSLFSDKHKPPSLEASVEEIRTRYQARYRQFWALPEMRELQANFPTWCIWDDHEIVNDWGAKPEHLQPEWQKVFDGARLAFADYQTSRTMNFNGTMPSSFHQSFVWGSTATFIMDLCSQRSFGGRESKIFDDEQLSALRAFLEDHQSRQVVFVVLTVPPVYLSDSIVSLGERVPRKGDVFATRWNSKRNKRSLDRLFDVLRQTQQANPKQKLVLLSGDVHQSAALKLRWSGGETAYQFVSSPITNGKGSLIRSVAKLLGFSLKKIQHANEQIAVERLQSARTGQRNPFGKLNFGVVYVKNEGGEAKLRFELVTHNKQSSEVAFDSGWL